MECCKLHSHTWTVVQRNVRKNEILINGLDHLETYGFRVFSHLADGAEPSEPSLPSQPVVIPPAKRPDGSNFTHHPLRKGQDLDFDGPPWQRDFERQFIELEELGRGRFGVVRRCQQLMTGSEVAVKFVNRKKQGRDITRLEFDIMSKLRHKNIVNVSGLYLTATSDAIVMNL